MIPHASTWSRMRSASAGRRRPHGASVALCVLIAFAAAGGLDARERIGPTPPGRVETGTPSLIVIRPENLGLTAAPTDMHVLPDGRILFVGPEELAIGDGIRWETYQRDPTTEAIDLENVAVDADGSIYAATPGSFSRIEFVDSGRWRFARVATLPDDPSGAQRTLLRLAVAGDGWFWHTGSGPVIAWKPGQVPKSVGSINDLECAFAAGGRVFFSDASAGTLHQLVGDHLELFREPARPTLDQTVTAAVPLPGGRVLLGTSSVGARVLDGDRLLAFDAQGPLDGRYRINDLCSLEGGLFAAAIDHLGVAVFDSTGRQVEVIDRAVQHQLARVRRLVPGPGGTLWALLTDGVACINVPSQVSSFDALVTTGITFSLVYRHEGELWLVSDGRVQRAVYDEDGRLMRFEVDGPSAYIGSLCTAFGALVACGTEGIYVREGSTWRLALPGIVNALVCDEAEPDGRHLYVARNEIGLLAMTPDGPSVERVATPELGEPFVGVDKAGADYWTELGSGRVARLRVIDGRPTVRIFGLADGLRDSWAQLFVVDDIARFNLAGRVMRLDEASQRFVTDDSFTALCGAPIAGHGRPARDASNRIWFAYEDTVRVAGGSGAQPEPRLPRALAPILFTMQEDGVVWMHQRQKLLRFDPAIPAPMPVPFRAMISRVQLAGSDRYLSNVPDRLPALENEDNTLAFHFLAPDAMFRAAVTFEVFLEGGGDTWMSTGPSGFASFNRLKEGSYVLHVRPRAGGLVGDEDALAFTIRPPWFRTPLAYWSYAIAGLVTIAGVGWGWSLLARRDKVRLESLVARRTAELKRSEEQYRHLSEELDQRVKLRTAELHRANDRLSETNRELEAFSYSVSHDLRAPLRGIDGWSHALMEDYGPTLDPTAQGYLARVRAEAQRLGHLIDDILALSRTTRAEFHAADIDLSALATQVARRVSATWREAPVEFTCDAGLRVHADPTLVEAALFNLLDNAWKFSSRSPRPQVRFGQTGTPEGPAFFVRDNGAGFDMRHAGKLFGVFQRLHTQDEFPGTGVGLATVRRIIQRHGGRIWAESAPQSGATFYFTLTPTTGHASDPQLGG